jgi:4-aminobutyrate aminotransferase-like enzyme
VTQLAIDSSALVPWQKIADVLGQSLQQFVEQFMRDCGRENEHFLILDEAVNTTLYATHEAAQAVAQRYELYMVERRFDGQKSVITVAEPVQAENGSWRIDADYLGEHGWMSEQEGEL